MEETVRVLEAIEKKLSERNAELGLHTQGLLKRNPWAEPEICMEAALSATKQMECEHARGLVLLYLNHVKAGGVV